MLILRYLLDQAWMSSESLDISIEFRGEVQATDTNLDVNQEQWLLSSL